MNNKNELTDKTKDKHVNIEQTNVNNILNYQTYESIGYNNTIIAVDSKIVLPVCTICS